jgi:hypothetical protein
LLFLVTYPEDSRCVQASSREYVIEFENAARSRMRIHLKGADGLDVAALGRSFWRVDEPCS